MKECFLPLQFISIDIGQTNSIYNDATPRPCKGRCPLTPQGGANLLTPNFLNTVQNPFRLIYDIRHHDLKLIWFQIFVFSFFYFFLVRLQQNLQSAFVIAFIIFSLFSIKYNKSLWIFNCLRKSKQWWDSLYLGLVQMELQRWRVVFVILS